VIFLLVHGSFHGGWCWSRVIPLLRAAGHEVFAPTLTGMGERSHLLRPEVGLATYIDDIRQVIEFEDLNGHVVLVGHSYSGMVIDGVAEAIPQRITRLIYLDAVVLEGGQSFFDACRPEIMEAGRALTRTYGEGWKMPPLPPEMFGISDEADRGWVGAKLTPQTWRSFEDRSSVQSAAGRRIPRAYIACTSPRYNPWSIDPAIRARERGFAYRELATGHDAMITAPSEVATTLIELASCRCPIA